MCTDERRCACLGAYLTPSFREEGRLDTRGEECDRKARRKLGPLFHPITDSPPQPNRPDERALRRQQGTGGRQMVGPQEHPQGCRRGAPSGVHDDKPLCGRNDDEQATSSSKQVSAKTSYKHTMCTCAALSLGG